MKTNATRIVEREKVEHRVARYDPEAMEADPRPLAQAVAEAVGLDPAQVFKTLVLQVGGQHALAVVPASAELDLKRLSKAMGQKQKARLVPLAEVQPITGYVRGGVTALGCKRRLPVIADASLSTHEEIAVSAGARGAQLILRPEDYLRVTGAKLAPIALS